MKQYWIVFNTFEFSNVGVYLQLEQLNNKYQHALCISFFTLLVKLLTRGYYYLTLWLFTRVLAFFAQKKMQK